MKNEKSLLLFILIHVFIFPNAISIISSILICSITCSKNRARSYLIFAFILSYALTLLHSCDLTHLWSTKPLNGMSFHSMCEGDSRSHIGHVFVFVVQE